MTEEDEAFNEIERQAKQRKESVKAAVHTLTEYQRGYEDGAVDGMQKQMQSSVDKAVNAMAQRTWVGLTRDEQSFVYQRLHNATSRIDSFWVDFANAIEAKLKEKNT
jgi:predicted transcriptional regulator